MDENISQNSENTSQQDFQAAMTNLINSIGGWANRVIEHFLPIFEHAYKAVYEQYILAGAIYGETQEGCLRWVEELAQVRRLEEEAQRIIDHHQGLAYLRKRLAEKKWDSVEP